MVIATLTHSYAHVNEALETKLPTLCADFTRRSLSRWGIMNVLHCCLWSPKSEKPSPVLSD
jgi:hypothetical protein